MGQNWEQESVNKSGMRLEHRIPAISNSSGTTSTGTVRFNFDGSKIEIKNLEHVKIEHMEVEHVRSKFGTAGN